MESLDWDSNKNNNKFILGHRKLNTKPKKLLIKIKYLMCIQIFK